MQITNKHNLPEAYVNIAKKVSRPPKEGVFHVTELTKAPQERTIVMNRYDEIVKDASDFLWAILGISVHYVLYKSEIANALAEEGLKHEFLIDGVKYKLVGRPDLFHDDTIQDYKVTSVWSFVYDKPEWDFQLNTYDFLYRQYKFNANKLIINGILRDWMVSQKVKKDYPNIPFQQKTIEKWATIHQTAMIITAIEDHNKNSMRPCTDKERWLRDEAWAVKKTGNKRAINGGVHDTEEKAEEMLATLKGHEIEHRPGTYMKCENYCDASAFCKQWKDK